MPKTFYTDHEIEDLYKRGVTSLQVDDNVVLTDLAREKARKLGMQLLSENDKPSSAPQRPYIAKQVSPSATAARPAAPVAAPSGKGELQQRVKSAVLAQLGGKVDEQLLDTIIQRVLNNIETN